MKHRAEGFARPRFWSRLPGLLAVAASLALAACGGGGGGGGGSNVAPTASFTVSPSSGTAPLLVTVNGSASSDSDGTINGYSWNFGDSSSGSGVSTTHTYTAGGNYTITLTVTDNKGKTGSRSQSLTVAAGPPPTSVTVSGEDHVRPSAIQGRSGGRSRLQSSEHHDHARPRHRGRADQGLQPEHPVLDVTDSTGNYVVRFGAGEHGRQGACQGPDRVDLAGDLEHPGQEQHEFERAVRDGQRVVQYRNRQPDEESRRRFGCGRIRWRRQLRLYRPARGRAVRDTRQPVLGRAVRRDPRRRSVDRIAGPRRVLEHAEPVVEQFRSRRPATSRRRSTARMPRPASTCLARRTWIPTSTTSTC